MLTTLSFLPTVYFLSHHCSMSIMTLKAGLEEAVKKVAPEVRAVIAEEIITEP